MLLVALKRTRMITPNRSDQKYTIRQSRLTFKKGIIVTGQSASKKPCDVIKMRDYPSLF